MMRIGAVHTPSFRTPGYLLAPAPHRAVPPTPASRVQSPRRRAAAPSAPSSQSRLERVVCFAGCTCVCERASGRVIPRRCARVWAFTARVTTCSPQQVRRGFSPWRGGQGEKNRKRAGGPGRGTGRTEKEPGDKERRRRLSLPAIPSNRGIHRSAFDESARPSGKNMNGRGKNGGQVIGAIVTRSLDSGTGCSPTLLRVTSYSRCRGSLLHSFLLRILKFMFRLSSMYFISVTGLTDRSTVSFESEIYSACAPRFIWEYLSGTFIALFAYVLQFIFVYFLILTVVAEASYRTRYVRYVFLLTCERRVSSFRSRWELFELSFYE